MYLSVSLMGNLEFIIYVSTVTFYFLLLYVFLFFVLFFYFRQYFVSFTTVYINWGVSVFDLLPGDVPCRNGARACWHLPEQ